MSIERYKLPLETEGCDRSNKAAFCARIEFSDLKSENSQSSPLPKFGPQPETLALKVRQILFTWIPPALFLALLIWHSATHAHQSKDPVPAAAWAFGDSE
jgi:hypothetical protein